MLQIFRPADLLDAGRDFSSVMVTVQLLYNIAVGTSQACVVAGGMWSRRYSVQWCVVAVRRHACGHKGTCVVIGGMRPAVRMWFTVGTAQFRLGV